MLAKRIIPCLDVKNGRTVKGVNFTDLRDAGDPVALAERYAYEGADELVFLDISATLEQRKTLPSLVRDVARTVNIPFTVGGGIGTVRDVSLLLNAGADKVTVNSSAVRNPSVIDDIANHFGSQCLVVAIDSGQVGGNHIVHTHGGTKPTPLHTLAWAQEACSRGAGEILLTSMNHDGTTRGFACALTLSVSTSVAVPVIASGGAGSIAHFQEIFCEGKADAALAASIFHYRQVGIAELKKALHKKSIPVRL